MRKNIYGKSIRRTIFASLGRYIAILAIIALGVGFFAGVKNTKGSMMETCNEYVTRLNMYDYRLISTLGFDEEDELYINSANGVAEAEGAVSQDFFSEDKGGNVITLRAHSVTDKINRLDIQKGRLPEKADECVVDGHFYDEEDIGSTIIVSKENDEKTIENFTYDEYKIVGIAGSPQYIMKTDRGTTSIGDGSINAYIYIPIEGFESKYFTEMLVTSEKQGYIFSKEYDKNIEKEKKIVNQAAEYRVTVRYDEIIEEASEKIEEGQKEVDEGRAKLKEEEKNAYAKLAEAKDKLDRSAGEIKRGKQTIKKERKNLENKKNEIKENIKSLEEAIEVAKYPQSGISPEQIMQMEGQVQTLKKALSEIDGGLKEISSKETELIEGEKELKSGYSRYEASKAEAEAKLKAASAEMDKGQREIDKSRKELNDMEEPELYVQTREDNTGFDSFESNADIVNSIAKVFPIFFFLIAALVCSTTMSRMIEEERGQIGTFRALGYTRGKIMQKYMIYSGSAALIGCIAGFFAGSKYFPYAIWIAYGMMFGFAPIEFYFNWELFAISLVVSLLCSLGTTYMACRGQLKHMPAEILRPKAPKVGKRILLEKMNFIWKKMKFLYKVSARNVFRYKKRMIMMMLGIGGCTALVMAGFGINDSVAGIASHQYSDIEKYDMTVAFSQELTDEELGDFRNSYGEDMDNMAVLQQTSVTVKGRYVNKTCSLMITDDADIEKAVSFKYEDKKVKYPGRGEAVVNNKMAEMLDIGVGDEVTINYDDTQETTLKISGIYKNYVSNYIYVNEETYEEYFNKLYEPNMAFVTVKKGVDIHDMSERFFDSDDVVGISVNKDVEKRVDDMMVSLNYIIVLVIGCAGALAFIVLFNLGNINITERVREIATIEVLGFYPRETGAYVFRENFILVILGIIAGFPTGYVLHKFIMAQINVDAVAFNEIIEPVSYVFTVLVVLGFSFIVDIIMRKKLRHINMAEALKSVE